MEWIDDGVPGERERWVSPKKSYYEWVGFSTHRWTMCVCESMSGRIQSSELIRSRTLTSPAIWPLLFVQREVEEAYDIFFSCGTGGGECVGGDEIGMQRSGSAGRMR